MRSTSNIFDKENRRRRGESDTASVDCWRVIEPMEKKAVSSRLMSEFFGDVVVKIKNMLDKDKVELKKALRKKKCQ